MRAAVRTKELSVVSLISALGAVLRTGLARIAYIVPYFPLPFGFSFYGIFIKLGLTETLTFICGFVFGPLQGFTTGALIIVVSDIFSIYGPGIWTPFIAAIMGLLGMLAGEFRRWKKSPTTGFLLSSAVALTLISELLQTIWFAWYMWVFYMPAVSFSAVLTITLLGGIASTLVALVNNSILFRALSPRIIKVLREPDKFEITWS